MTLTSLDGDERKILLDTGWNNDWMDYVFARHQVDRMLERGEIDFMVLSHWHLDHYWGIESTLKHHPQLKLYAPATWRVEDQVLLKEKGNIQVEGHDGYVSEVSTVGTRATVRCQSKSNVKVW